MKIKTKITLWVGLLLFLILLLASIGVGYVNKIKKSTDDILITNNLSIQYAQNMLDAINLSFQNEEAIESTLAP